jgi:hypothetical protein
VIETAEEFVRLRTSQAASDYNRAAREPAALEVWLDVIARFPDMRQWVAHNKTIPMEILRHLADDPDRDVRLSVLAKRKVLSRSHVDRPLVEKFSRDPDVMIRAGVAFHRNTPRDIIERLAKEDSSSWVRGKAMETLALLNDEAAAKA